VRIVIEETTAVVGPSDWEAEGRVAPRTLHVARFAIDAFELSGDDGRARANLTRDESRAICTQKGGRLPTEDEWLAAAAGKQPRRYPWGDTGAVCRRGAWGTESGPCAWGATGPDTVGAHADGDTASGIHDLAGNVAEWVEAGEPGGPGVVRGGSFRSILATELRTWSWAEVAPDARLAWVGARCAYDAPPR
jgi:formylglycine-generating enzyme required for sulfatase activity